MHLAAIEMRLGISYWLHRAVCRWLKLGIQAFARNIVYTIIGEVARGQRFIRMWLIQISSKFDIHSWFVHSLWVNRGEHVWRRLEACLLRKHCMQFCNCVARIFTCRCSVLFKHKRRSTNLQFAIGSGVRAARLHIKVSRRLDS